MNRLRQSLKETLDYFIDTLISIAEEAKNDPDKVLEAPYTTVIDRLDEATAARKTNIKV
ncbi:glycine dehydrogenase subunit 2 [Staphylococcus aureus]|nr:glycine dehydrogenase subunit 2 [Staphylococcus aureus]